MTAQTGAEDSVLQRGLAWIGGISLLPLAILAFVEERELLWFWRGRREVPEMGRVFGWIIGVAGTQFGAPGNAAIWSLAPSEAVCAPLF